MKSSQSSSSSRSFRHSTLRSISVVFSGALLACSLAAGCGDDEEGNGGRGGRGGSGGRDASAGSGGGGGLAGSGGSSGSGGATAGTGGTAGDASTSEAGDSGGEAGPPARMELRNTSKVGTVLQANGRTLYFFGGDAPAGENTHPEAGAPRATSAQANCSSNCLRPFHTGSLSLGFGMSRLDFGEFKRRDGQWQSTYRGWPLYTADTDTVAGELTADGQNKLWHAVAVPFYSVIIRRSIVSERRRDAAPSTYEYTYLADGAGMSLYMYWHDLQAADGGRASSGCDGQCLVAWPPTHHGDLKIVSSLSASDFDFLRWTPDYGDAGPPVGQMDQLTYKGWLMYYYWRDYVPGDTVGHCSRQWSLAEIDGNFITLDECALP